MADDHDGARRVAPPAYMQTALPVWDERELEERRRRGTPPDALDPERWLDAALADAQAQEARRGAPGGSGP